MLRSSIMTRVDFMFRTLLRYKEWAVLLQKTSTKDAMQDG